MEMNAGKVDYSDIFYHSLLAAIFNAKPMVLWKVKKSVSNNREKKLLN